VTEYGVIDAAVVNVLFAICGEPDPGGAPAREVLDKLNALAQEVRLDGVMMRCWNALSPDQQARLVATGDLPWRYEGDGCSRDAVVGIVFRHDRTPGPRHYCLPCALEYLHELAAAGDGGP